MDDVGHPEVRPVAGEDEVAVAHDGDPVGDLEDLLEPMGHVEHRHAVGPQLAQDAEEAPGLALVERGVGLVEDEQAWPLDEDAADLHELAVIEVEVADERLRVGGEADALEHGTRSLEHRVVVDEAAASRLANQGRDWRGSIARGRG